MTPFVIVKTRAGKYQVCLPSQAPGEEGLYEVHQTFPLLGIAQAWVDEWAKKNVIYY